MTTTATATITIRQLSAREFGNGLESAGAENEFWAALPSMDVAKVASIVREIPVSDRYAVIVAAIKGQPGERVTALKSLFTADELKEMLSR